MIKLRKPRVGLLVVCFAFFFIFCCWNTLSSRVTTVFKDLVSVINLRTMGTMVRTYQGLFIFLSQFSVSSPLKFFENVDISSLSCLVALAMRSSSSYFSFFALTCVLPAYKVSFNIESDSILFGKQVIYTLTLVGCSLNGIGASLVWVAQGSYLAQIAPPQQLGLFMGIFQLFFSLSMIAGPLITGIVYTRAFEFFIMMSVFALLGTLTFLFLPRIQKKIKPKARASLEQLPATARTMMTGDVSSTTVLPFSQAELKQKQTFCRVLCSKHMCMQLPSLFHMGVSLTYFSIILSDSAASFARDQGASQAQANRKSSLIIFTIGVMQLISGPICGKILDKWGVSISVAIRYSSGILTYSVAIVSFQSKQFNIYWFITAGLYGISSSFQKTINFTIAGSQFISKKESFAILRLVSSVSAAVTAFVAPFFLKDMFRQAYTAGSVVIFIISETLVLRSQTSFPRKMRDKNQEQIKD